MTERTAPAPATAGALASPELLAQLDEIGRVEPGANDVIDEAIRAGVPLLEISRRTGRDRSALYARRRKIQDATR